MSRDARMPGRALSALRRVDARAKLLFLAVFIVATLQARTPAALGCCLVLAVALACAARLGKRELRAVFLPLLPILAFTALMQALSLQQGNVLFALGPVAVTTEALAESARMVAALLALMLASAAFMRCTTAEELVALLRWAVRPVRAAGGRGDAFVLSVSVALGFLPVLVGEFRQLKAAQVARLASFDGGVRARVRAYARLFAPLLRSAFAHADTLADALLARGFSAGPVPTSLHEPRFGGREAACVALAALLAAVVAFA